MTPLHLLPELANYQDEPKQLATGSPGKVAQLRLGFEQRRGKTILAQMYRRAPLIVQRALYFDEQMPLMPCVFIISNAGGILQGDRNTIDVTLGAHALAHLTTQSATKIQEMDANYASQIQNITLKEGAYFEYVPHPIIPHRHSRFVMHTTMTIDPTATLFASEIIMGGRKHHGDLFEFDLISSTLSAKRPDGRALFTEKLVIEPHQQRLRQAGIMGEFDVFGTAVLITDKKHFEPIFENSPFGYNSEEGWATGTSRLPNDAGLIFKVLSSESYIARQKIREFWTLVRRQLFGVDIMKQYSWH